MAADARREQCLEERLSLAFETVMSAPNKVEFVARAKESEVFLFGCFSSAPKALINASRVVPNASAGGHDVPIPKIIGRYSKSIANCARVTRYADRVYLYDNSLDLVDPRLILKVKDGNVAKVYSAAVPNWAQTIIDALSSQDASVPIVEDA